MMRNNENLFHRGGDVEEPKVAVTSDVDGINNNEANER
jgi:hypothetical protein